jgi:hypothetical protein
MSKLLMKDARCGSCSAVFEDLVPTPATTTTCPKCGGEAKVLISCPRLDPRMGVDPTFGTMADKWARTHRQQAAKARRMKQEHGETI